MTGLSEEEIMAFADGALDPARMREIGAMAANDPVLAAEVERLRNGAAALGGAFQGQLDVAVPEHLRAIVEKPAPASVAAFTPRRMHAPIWASAAAAAACVLVGFGIGRMNGYGGGLLEMRRDHALVAANDLRGALENTASGVYVGDVRIALTFPQTNGGYCRIFRIDRGDGAATAGLACKEDDDWTIVSFGQAGGEGLHAAMAQAGANIPEAVLQAAADRQAGDALDANAELAALRARWRPR